MQVSSRTRPKPCPKADAYPFFNVGRRSLYNGEEPTLPLGFLMEYLYGREHAIHMVSIA